MSDDVKPIRSEADYEDALAEVERLWGSKGGTPKGDRLDVLATLIEAYEEKNYPIDVPDPIDAIKIRMEQQGLTRKDLVPLLGGRTRVSEVLNGRRALSIAMIRRLAAKLGIPAVPHSAPAYCFSSQEDARFSWKEDRRSSGQPPPSNDRSKAQESIGVAGREMALPWPKYTLRKRTLIARSRTQGIAGAVRKYHDGPARIAS